MTFFFFWYFFRFCRGKENFLWTVTDSSQFLKPYFKFIYITQKQTNKQKSSDLTGFQTIMLLLDTRLAFKVNIRGLILPITPLYILHNLLLHIKSFTDINRYILSRPEVISPSTSSLTNYVVITIHYSIPAMAAIKIHEDAMRARKMWSVIVFCIIMKHAVQINKKGLRVFTET